MTAARLSWWTCDPSSDQMSDSASLHLPLRTKGPTLGSLAEQPRAWRVSVEACAAQQRVRWAFFYHFKAEMGLLPF